MLLINCVSETRTQSFQLHSNAIKKCWKCNTEKSLEDYYKNKYKKDGLQDICKNCNRETCKNYNKKHPEKTKAKRQRVFNRNIQRTDEELSQRRPNKICNKCKTEKPTDEFYRCNSKTDGFQGYCKNCASQHNKSKFLKNKEKHYTYIKKWRKKNPLTVRAMKANRRSREMKAEGRFSKKTIQNLYVKQEGRCVCCGELLQGVFDVDHIVALSRGGSNFPENLQLLTPTCNKSKGAKTMSEYMQFKTGGIN